MSMQVDTFDPNQVRMRVRAIIHLLESQPELLLLLNHRMIVLSSLPESMKNSREPAGSSIYHQHSNFEDF
jgi:hypothetical protein